MKKRERMPTFAKTQKLAKILKTIDFWVFRQFSKCFLLAAMLLVRALLGEFVA